ncbi:MAG: hypothetical protein HY804_13795 [Nitrospinae bacterium]|nr:hypothetical protein [Nitrospinota bacterium]
MVVLNYAARELTAKIVYYGPGLCGKTTNLEIIHDKMDPSRRGQMMSMATETDRTLFFDLLPVDLGEIGGFKIKIQLFTVPGQTFYNATRRLVLRGADGIVFVADSQAKQLAANVESMENLKENLGVNNLDFNTIPMVIQLNKQDLPPLTSDAEMNLALNPRKVPTVKAVAFEGRGVFETFKAISQETLKSLRGKFAKPGSAPPPPSTAPAHAPARTGDAARVKITSAKQHIPEAAAVSSEQVKREMGIESTGEFSRVALAWMELVKHGDLDMNKPETVELLTGIQRNLLTIIENNKKMTSQYESLYRLMERLAKELKSGARQE